MCHSRRYIEIERTAHGNIKAFRTGDLARFINGRVQLLVRIDDDAKLRGARINLGEVEAQLMALPEIASAVAVAVNEGMGPRALRADVTLKDQVRQAQESYLRKERPNVSINLGRLPQKEDIEDIYPLTPMQNGILFHALQAERSGPYVEQFVFDSTRLADPERLAASWTAVVNRHPLLRTGFVWEGLDEPLQVVVKRCAVRLDLIDLTGRSPEQVDQELKIFLTEDRARGFNLADAPLMRLTFLQNDTGCILVWTLHHLIMDGWSMPITIAEVAERYKASGTPASNLDLPPVTPFREYVTWLNQQRSSETELFWREQMRDRRNRPFRLRTPGLPSEQRGTAGDGSAYHDLNPALSAALVGLGRRARVTLSTVFQAGWALLIARHTEEHDVVFGMTVSGRPADLPQADSIVGVFINTIPRRVLVDDAAPLGKWLRDLQSGYLDTLPHQYAGLPDIQKLADPPRDAALFDSIVVFENYPNENPDFNLGDGVEFTVREIIEDSAYPLMLTVLPRSPSMRLQLLYAPESISDDSAKTILGRLETVLSAIATLDPDGPDGEVRRVGILSDEARRVVASMQGTADRPGGLPARQHLHVLDSRLELMPVGVVGTVHVTDKDYLPSRGETCSCRDVGLRGYRSADGMLEIVTMEAEASSAGHPHREASRRVPEPGFFQRPAASALRDLWVEALGRAIDAPDIDFFRAGGNSLAAVRLIGKIRVLFDAPIPVNALFEDRSLQKLLGRIDKELGGQGKADGVVQVQRQRNTRA